MAAAKRKGKHAGGRPSHGLTEGVRLVRGPDLLLLAMDQRAEALGVTGAEAWRRAARAWLGWHEVLPPPKP